MPLHAQDTLDEGEGAVLSAALDAVDEAMFAVPGPAPRWAVVWTVLGFVK